MTRKLTLIVLGMLTLSSMAWASPLEAPAHRAIPTTTVASQRIRPISTTTVAPAPPEPAPTYRYGDCDWVRGVAAEAGWPAETHRKLIKIAARESGCCPNVKGGDVVNGDCEVIRVSEWNHRSDSGLMQINGVHWKPDHPQYHGLVCRQLGVCTQEPLLDPLTNLRAAKLLWDVAGWSPWRVPSN